MRILIAEDDTHLAAALAQILRDNSYDADVVHDGQAAIDYGSSASYDVIILDVMLPKADGFTVASELRRAHVNTPILMLTAKDQIRDKITGLDSGADDYMTKPFSPVELLAHLRALTRRRGNVVFESLEAGDLALNLETMDLACKTQCIRLSPKEFAIMRILMSAPGTVLSKDALIERAWGLDSSTSDNNVEAYISFLRKKLAHLDSQAHIETIRSLGYRLIEGNEA